MEAQNSQTKRRPFIHLFFCPLSSMNNKAGPNKSSLVQMTICVRSIQRMRCDVFKRGPASKLEFVRQQLAE